ncbi:protein KTI12 homolog [Tubulanus polymorphus]|uniref:protein KTI12 homolog n=1 Tax=Tubulanus polymorphus TaxID=672921 RepID=UPI003DA20A79
MPFVMMCGFPCSGKTTRAEQLKRFIEENRSGVRVHIITESDLGKNIVYIDSLKEKETRATLKSEVQRKISKEDVVILDSLNYIKGFRYELFCVTKSAQTPQCVIFCDISEELCKQWNSSRPDADQYSHDVLNGLLMRFECPDSRNRWDSPLFTIQTDDELPYADICNALFNQKAPPPNQSTQSQPLSSSDFLYELDRITKEIISEIMSSQKTAVPGDELKISAANDSFSFQRVITLAELQRSRRQFITYTKVHTVDVPKIANLFVQYLNNSVK